MISGFKGIYRTDSAALAVYSEAAGIARIIPSAVAVPYNADDVVHLVRWARSEAKQLIPRGSGSSMAGGAIGSGVIVDLSQISWIAPPDIETQRIRVGPGALRNEVDLAAREVGLRFPPDPSSGKFCTIGGMISTNAAGSHTLKFGPTRGWVYAIDCVFEDGSRATIRRGEPAPADIPAVRRILDQRSTLQHLSQEDAFIHPNVFKDTSGYDIHDYLRTGDLVDLLIGSEGTLAIIVGAELQLTPLPIATSSILATFASLEDAVTAAISARNSGAAACELLDRTYLDIVAQRIELLQIPPNTEAVLLAEVEGDSLDDAKDRAKELSEIFETANATRVTLALNPVDEHDLWELRHAASPTLATLGPTLTSMQFIEDTAVPPANFSAYVRGIRQIFETYKIPGVIFGHAGDAHAHVNPLIDTSRPGWQSTVSTILNEVTELTHQLGGTLAGEHGDGRLRTPLMERIWSPAAIAGFRIVKTAFDPKTIFNPGVKVATVGQQAISDIKYDTTLPEHPRAAQKALRQVAENRAYDVFRLDLIE